MTAALLRPANQADTAALLKIYAHAVEHSIGTFEEEVPRLDEMEQRRASLSAQKFPYLVAEIDHVVVGFPQMVAVVGGTDNQPSIGLHKTCGFAQVGGFQNIGFKFGRWAGIVFLQRELGAGASTLP